MGWQTRRWPEDEDVLRYANEVIQGASDEDAAAALAAALLLESAGGND
jgi:hypothetical protein